MSVGGGGFWTVPSYEIPEENQKEAFVINKQSLLAKQARKVRTTLNLSGIFPPICTPFHADGSLALPELKRNIAIYNETAVGGYVVAGSTGEAVMLSEKEKLQVWESVAESCGAGKLLIAGTGAQSTRETVTLTQAAADLGYHAALVLTPSFFKAQMTRPESQLDFYTAVADAASIPIILYNFPQMTGIDLDSELMARIVEHPNIIAIKESSADLDKIRKLVAIIPQYRSLLVGASPVYETCLSIGATGGILAVANVLPRTACEIHDLYREGDTAGAKVAQQRIFEAASVPSRFGIQGLKFAMDQRGFFGGSSRRPLQPLDAQQRSAIEAIFRSVPPENLD